MSTQTLIPTPELPLIDEKPPAGTPCVNCKRLGHWCPAIKYIGQTDDGICKDCADGKNCPVAARLKEKEYLTPDVFDVPKGSIPPPVKHHPVPKHQAARNESIKAALAGAVGRDAIKVPVPVAKPAPVVQAAKRTARPPVIPVPSVMEKYRAKPKAAVTKPVGRPAKTLDPAKIHELRAQGLGPKRIAVELRISVKRVKQELNWVTLQTKPRKVTVVTMAQALSAPEVEELRVRLEDHVRSADPVDPAPPPAPRKPILEAMDEVIAHLEAEMASIRATVEMLKKRRGTE